MSIDTLLLQAATYSHQGRLDLVEPLLREVRLVAPRHLAACLELARVFILGGRYDEAAEALEPLSGESTDGGAEVHRRLALAHSFAGRGRVALAHYRRALDLEPGHGQTLHSIANLEQALGLTDAAADTWRRAVAAKPLWTMPAASGEPEFRVMWTFAPGAGNTPPDYFVEQARFDSDIFTVLNDFEYDIDLLRSRAHVVVNLVSDVDRSRDVLQTVETLVEKIGRPVINPPRSIVGTDRESIALRLAGTAGCIVPRTRRLPADEMWRLAEETGGAAGLAFPLLIRPVGTHGGEDLEKIDDRVQIDAFVDRAAALHYYVTPFVDYRSADGYFRKYRFIYVGDEILPYHLAIDEKWKVHHITTPMADVAWMQDEEHAFLDDPWRVFGAPQQAALRAIRDVIGLDYFGIDCSLSGWGEIVVFEVNATMLVHGRNDRFPYKHEAVSRIRQAFHALLERTARVTSLNCRAPVGKDPS